MIGWIVCGISAVANILMVWYCRELIARHINYLDQMEETLQSIQKYKGHLQEVYGLEMYYGDATLHGLLEHTSDLAESIILLERSALVETEEKENLDNAAQPQVS